MASTNCIYPNLPYSCIICRYGEIALKKKNRRQFEMRLVHLLQHATEDIPDIRIRRMHGRMTISKSQDQAFTPDEVSSLRLRLQRIFGLNSFSFGFLTPAELPAMEHVISEVTPKILAESYADRQTVTYRMRARRSTPHFPLNSKEIEIHFADILLARFPQLKLDLDHAEFTIELEIREGKAFIGFERHRSLAGLPPGSSASVLTLLSGGIDSPVAAWMMMSRGCNMNFLTFHSYPYTQPELLEKVARIAHQLNRYQLPGRLFACNIAEAQRMIRDCCQERFRTLLYRRLMFRIATHLAIHLGDQALVTGESVGQVASQTIPNLQTIAMATPMLVLRPLIGIDKQATVQTAREIGTFDLSVVDCADSCTVFQPSSPATKAHPHLLDAEEAKLDYSRLLECSLQNIEEVTIPAGETHPFPLPADLPTSNSLFGNQPS